MNKTYVVMQMYEDTESTPVMTIAVPRYSDDIEATLEGIFSGEIIFAGKQMIKCSGDLIDFCVDGIDSLEVEVWVQEILEESDGLLVDLERYLYGTDYTPSLYDSM